MALPQPTFLPYKPNEFVNAEPTVSRGLELFARYHPSQMQQAMYEQLLEEYERRDVTAQEQMKLLSDERDAIMKNLNSFRETGLGPSGKATGLDTGTGTGTGGRKGGPGGYNLPTMVQAASQFGGRYNDRKIASAELSIKNQDKINREYQTGRQENTLIRTVLANAARASGGTTRLDPSVLGANLDSVMLAYYDSIDPNNQNPNRNRAAAASLYTALKFQYPASMTPQIAARIDALFGTGTFIQESVGSGSEPSRVIDQEKNARLRGAEVAIGEEGFEQRIAKALETATLEGATPQEVADLKSRLIEQREALGIAEPLTTEEQAFLQTYVNALRDDGQADLSEFETEDEYNAARAAYEKGRMLERLPRGTSAFYDESYLRGLGRLGEIDTRMAELEGRPSAGQPAAQQTLGLPTVTADQFQRASQISPLVSQALPYTVKRFQDQAGSIQPRDDAERVALQLIQRGDRNVQAFMQQVNKLYPNDADKRRTMLAFFGAHNMQQDARNTTFNTGALTGNAQQAASEAAQFARQVQPDFAPAPVAAPVAAPAPAPVVAPVPVPVIDTEAARRLLVEEEARRVAAKQIRAHTPEGLFADDVGSTPQAYR